MQLQQSPSPKPNQYDELQQQPQNLACDPPSSSPIATQRYKSFYQVLRIILNISLSSFYFGYAIAYFSAVDFDTIAKVYKIEMKKQVAEGLLVACMPIGGGVGALASSLLIKRYSRRQCILIVNALAFITGILLFLPHMETLLLCRILQGLCAGFYSSLTPLIMKQLSPREISGTLTSCNQIMIAFGVFFAFAFSEFISRIFDDPLSEKTWWIMFGFGLVIVAVQSFILTVKYNFETPKYLYEKLRDQQGKKLIERIYKEEFVQSVVRQIMEDVGRGKTSSSQQIDTNTASTSHMSTPRAATIIAIHLAALQQFSGINAVIAYGGQIVGEDVPSLKLALPILINLEQVIAAIFTSYLLTKIGRKVMFQYGCIGASVSCLVIAFGFWSKQEHHSFGLGLIIVGLFLFMANFGLTLGPVVWVYLPQIVQSQVMPYATATNWGMASLIMLTFPMIKQRLPNKNPAWLFVFFALWCAAGFWFNRKYLIETRNKTEKEIAQEYRAVNIGC